MWQQALAVYPKAKVCPLDMHKRDTRNGIRYKNLKYDYKEQLPSALFMHNFVNKVDISLGKRN